MKINIKIIHIVVDFSEDEKLQGCRPIKNVIPNNTSMMQCCFIDLNKT